MFYLALGFSKEDPRDARYSSRYYRIGPPPIVGPLLTGLGCFCLPNVLSQQRLRVVDAKVCWGATPGEGCKQWLHCRGGEEILVHEIHTEPAAGYRQCARSAEKRAGGGFGN